MGRTPVGGGPAFRFMASEVVDMEKALDASSGATPARSIVEALADKFTNSTERAGQKPVQWKQVWNWFQNRRHALKGKSAKTPDKLKSVGSGGENTPVAKAVAATAPSTGKKSDGLMDFEAKSGRDGAWYDVSALISKRTGEGGAAEVRVRFAGFGSEEDEWVNITTAVRQRSLPCEATECVAVLPGDLILCFQEGHEQALYFDADILDVQRRRHDVRGCRCRFWVRYLHDQTEEVVPLRKVCRRPETEQRLQAARDAGASSSKTANPPIDKALNVTPITSVKTQTFPTTPATPAIPAIPAQSIAISNTPTLPNDAPQDPIATPQGTTPVQLSSSKQTQIPVHSIGTLQEATPVHQSATLQEATPLHSIATLQEATPAQPVVTNQVMAPVQPSATPSSDVAQAPSSPASLQLKDAAIDVSTPAQAIDVTPGTGANVETPNIAASEAPTSVKVDLGATDEPAPVQASAPSESAPVEAPAEQSKPIADPEATAPSETA